MPYCHVHHYSIEHFCNDAAITINGIGCEGRYLYFLRPMVDPASEAVVLAGSLMALSSFKVLMGGTRFLE